MQMNWKCIYKLDLLSKHRKSPDVKFNEDTIVLI